MRRSLAWRLVLAGLMALASWPVAAATVSFGGYEWLIRSYGGGPGPNEWDSGNVYVDESGLHLRISRRDGVWTCAEVVMTETLGFGTYQFEITGRPDLFDRNVVLGLFNYPPSAEVGPDGSNEIDIEFAQWGNLNVQNRLNWTVYPPALGPEKGHRDGPIALNGEASTHRFEWSADGVRYGSFHGYADAGDAYPIAEWTYAPDDPATQIPQVPLSLHMNLWLLNGEAPSDGQEVEVVIRSFSFTPN